MPLVYSAILPHSPVLLPGLSQSHGTDFDQTIAACRQIGDEISQTNPDILIVISPHGVIKDNFWIINTAMEFEADFTEFGDLGTKLKISGDLELPGILTSGKFNHPVEAVSIPKLDYGTAVSLTFLENNRSKLLPIYSSNLSNRQHYEFGIDLIKTIQSMPQNIALIASGDLSHRLNRRSPAGYSPKAKWFDKRVIKALETKKTDELIRLDSEIIEKVEECGLKPIMMLLGMMRQLDLQAEIISYSYPVGVGWLTAKLSYPGSSIK